MNRKNIAAWTAPGDAWPSYVSVNRTSEGVEITVRGGAKHKGDWIECGDTASVTLSSSDFHAFVEALRGHPNQLLETDT